MLQIWKLKLLITYIFIFEIEIFGLWVTYKDNVSMQIWNAEGGGEGVYKTNR